MKLFDRIILTIYTLCFTVVSVVMILFPFKSITLFSVDNMENYLLAIKGNYWYSLVGLAFLLVSVRLLISGLSKDKKSEYIVRHTSLGELKISTQTVEGLAQSVTSNFDGIKDIKTSVRLRDDSIIVIIKGQVNPDIIIPETTTNIQTKVKEHIERCTGVEVLEIKVEVTSITTPMKAVK